MIAADMTTTTMAATADMSIITITTMIAATMTTTIMAAAADTSIPSSPAGR